MLPKISLFQSRGMFQKLQSSRVYLSTTNLERLRRIHEKTAAERSCKTIFLKEGHQSPGKTIALLLLNMASRELFVK